MLIAKQWGSHWTNMCKLTESFFSGSSRSSINFFFFSSFSFLWVSGMISSSQVNSWRVKTQSKPLRTKHIASTCNISAVFHESILYYLRLAYHRIYGSFTLPDIETDTHIDKMCTEPNGNLHCSPFLSSMNTSTQFYASHFISVRLCLGVWQCKHTISIVLTLITTKESNSPVRDIRGWKMSKRVNM